VSNAIQLFGRELAGWNRRLAVRGLKEPCCDDYGASEGGALAGKQPKEVQQIYDGTRTGRTPCRVALRWVWNHPEVTVVLSGMNDEKQVEENIKTAENALPGSLSPEDLAVMGKVASSYRRLMKVPCTGCAYCMPCPNGVTFHQTLTSTTNTTCLTTNSTQEECTP